MKKIKWGSLILSIFIPLAVGTASGLIARAGEAYGAMIKPEGSPPAWIFPVVWTILFALMGISSFLIYNADASEKSKMSALIVYAIQLIVNFMWPIFFFRLGAYLSCVALGARADNDIEILQNQSHSCIFAASVSTLAYIRGLSEPFRVSA